MAGLGLIKADPRDVLGLPLGVDEVTANPLPLPQGARPGGVAGVEEWLGVHVGTGGQLADRCGRYVNTATVRQAVLVHGISFNDLVFPLLFEVFSPFMFFLSFFITHPIPYGGMRTACVPILEVPPYDVEGEAVG